MATFSTTLDSSWALPDLFNYMATFSNAAEWDPSVTSGEALSAGLPRLHSTYLLSLAVSGREISLVYEVVEFDRLRRVVLSAGTKMLRSLAEIEVTPSPKGTMLTYSATISGLGPLAGADPLMARMIRRSGSKAEAGLRTRIDA
jgi:Polyketide cyclase / dehydrase and lipid transport